MYQMQRANIPKGRIKTVLNLTCQLWCILSFSLSHLASRTVIAHTCFFMDCNLNSMETDKAVNKGSIQAYL